MNLTVSSRKGIYGFHAIIHECLSLSDLELPIDEFYVRWGQRIPTVPHYEIEIVSPDIEFLREMKAHAQQIDNGQRAFVCFPSRIASVEKAEELFRTWCLGTVCGFVEGIDLNVILREYKGDHRKMEEGVRERFEILFV